MFCSGRLDRPGRGLRHQSCNKLARIRRPLLPVPDHRRTDGLETERSISQLTICLAAPSRWAPVMPHEARKRSLDREFSRSRGCSLPEGHSFGRRHHVRRYDGSRISPFDFSATSCARSIVAADAVSLPRFFSSKARSLVAQHRFPDSRFNRLPPSRHRPSRASSETGR